FSLASTIAGAGSDDASAFREWARQTGSGVPVAHSEEFDEDSDATEEALQEVAVHRQAEVSSEQTIMEELRKCIVDQTHSATFACGGSIPIMDDEWTSHAISGAGRNISTSTDEARAGTYADPIDLEARASSGKALPSRDQYDTSPFIRPIVVRWDTPEGALQKVTLPANEAAAETHDLKKFIFDCQPATFGY
ncbi:hypothetical protein LTS18_010721, partial [Coniosporium uncinatum]